MLKDLISKGASYATALISNPDFLIGTGMGITTVSTIIAFIEGTKVKEDLDKKSEELGRELSKPEKVCTYAKHAILPAVASATGEAMIFVGTRKQSKTIQLLGASLQAATLYSNAQGEKITSLEQSIKNALGEKKSNDIISQPAMDRFKNVPPVPGSNIYETGKGAHQVVFQFEPDGSYFWSSYEQLKLDEAEFNKEFTKGSASLATLKQCIGLPSGEIDERMLYEYNDPGEWVNFIFKPDEGGFIEYDGVKRQYCLLRFGKDPVMY